MGYSRAGFAVTGVDIAPQKNYPFAFVQGDALAYLAAHGREYDVIHASPPCQTHTRLKSLYQYDDGYKVRHADLIAAVRELLNRLGKPYVIENVPGAPLRLPVVLCGAMFGLKVYRHRLFETSPWMLSPGHIPHHDQTPAVGRGTSPKGFISITGTGGFGVPDGWAYAQNAMGIAWMSRLELSQAIPPAYTEYIGLQLMRVL